MKLNVCKWDLNNWTSNDHLEAYILSNSDIINALNCTKIFGIAWPLDQEGISLYIESVSTLHDSIEHLLYTRHNAEHSCVDYLVLSSHQHHEIGIIIITPVLQMRKLATTIGNHRSKDFNQAEWL